MNEGNGKEKFADVSSNMNVTTYGEGTRDEQIHNIGT